MAALGSVFGWLARKGLLYALLVAALVAAAVFAPLIESQWRRPEQMRQRLGTLRSVQDQIASERAAAASRLQASVDRTRGAGVAAIDARLAETRGRRARLEGERPKTSVAVRFALGGRQAVLDDQRREVEIALAEREIASLQAARSLAVADANMVRFESLAARARAADAQGRACDATREAVARFDRQWLGRRILDFNERRTLVDRRDERCRTYAISKARIETEIAARARALQVQRRARLELDAQARTVDATLASATAALDAQVRDDATTLNGSVRRKAELFAARVDLRGKMRAAAVALAVILATPFLIRLLLFFVLAPAAARRAAIRLTVPGGRGAAIPLPGRSTTSVAVQLEPHEEVLVRQDFLQSTSHIGDKATRWLLDWRHPLSSIATGLTFLTRIQGTSEVTTVSAVRDPFAEVAVLTLPEGSSCVLQPRALAAVAQPVARKLRITSHWRLTSLNAWLTLQLRYLVFHGPARLVIKGGRGVRVERAEAGRVFGQDQLVGFSADLAYSVTRTETFWPYFLGREPLLKDKVQAGEGVLIVEEAPMAGREAGGARRGFEGAMDAALKVFGL